MARISYHPPRPGLRRLVPGCRPPRRHGRACRNRQGLHGHQGQWLCRLANLKDDPECDARLKEFKATVRNIPLKDEFDGAGKCIVTGEPVDRRVVIAKAY
jgi:hypothetical protein